MRWLFLAVLVATPAFAYPWMVKHGYQACASCHVDPSGAGQLTPYGRAQSDVTLRWRVKPMKEGEEASKTANFLWFLELPEVINLSGNFRYGSLIRPQSSTAPFVPLLMATDLYATLNLGPVVAHVTTGVGTYRPAAAQYFGPAAIAPSCAANETCSVQWIAREFWLGGKFADDAVMLRAGRINLPFGLRNNEHTSWVRSMTRTDVNIHQQVGLAASYNGDNLRGEVMGIAGNFQIGPDAYRERGYSAFAEYAFGEKAFVGASSLITHAASDPVTLRPTTRHAHGLFARVAPSEKLAILAEADFIAFQSPQVLDRLGFAAMLQGDLNLMPGLHVLATLEGMHTGQGEWGPSLGAWLSATWYFLPHVELRLDNVLRRYATASATASVEYQLLVQLHFFL